MFRLRKIMNLEPKSLEQIKQEISGMSVKMEQASKKICKELAEYGLEEMQRIYNNFDLKSNKPSTFRIDGTDNNKQVIMEGEQAIYDEFGTGTEGSLRPHPIKKEFNLNDYNSGKTIKTATKKVSAMTTFPEGSLYWVYKNVNGELVFTQGTPAQKEGYDSVIATIKKSDEIILKNLKEVLKDG